jgi:hypothetical protein
MKKMQQAHIPSAKEVKILPDLSDPIVANNIATNEFDYTYDKNRETGAAPQNRH